jgi:hypothetical protein
MHEESTVSDEAGRTKTEDEEPAQDDTEGHSLATYEYGRVVARERMQDAERAAREARMREEQRRNRR